MRLLLSLLLILQTTFTNAAAYNEWQAQTTAISHVIGGVAGYAASGGEGANVSAGANISQSGFTHNYLTHDESEMREAARQACDAGNKDACSQYDALNQLDEARDRELALSCYLSNGPLVCEDAVRELIDAENSYDDADYFLGVGDLLEDLVDEDWYDDTEIQQFVYEVYGGADSYNTIATENAEILDMIATLEGNATTALAVIQVEGENYVENVSAPTRFTLGVVETGADSVMGLFDLFGQIAVNSYAPPPEYGNLASSGPFSGVLITSMEISQSIAENPQAVIDGVVDPFTDRWAYGDQAGAFGYVTVGVAELFAGGRGAGSIDNFIPPKTGGALGNVPNGADDVFRGTTVEFEGGNNTLNSGTTPTSTDPFVATCYAQNACSTHGGAGVVHVVDPDIADDVMVGEIGQLPQDFEVGLVGVNPSQVADSATSSIPVDGAIGALNQMGIDVPNTVGPAQLNDVLIDLQQNGTTPLSSEQVQQFLDLTGSN